MDDIKQKLKEFRSNKAKENLQTCDGQLLGGSRSPSRFDALNHSTTESSRRGNIRNNEESPDDISISDNSPTTLTDRLQRILIQLLVWFACFGVALKFEFGIVYTIASGFYVLWKSLGRRKSNEPSAYSVFNPNCERLLGTLTAEQFENEIRHGPQGM